MGNDRLSRPTRHLIQNRFQGKHMPVPDLFLQGVARGWQVIDAATLENETTLEADVIIIGTGAGGGTSAEILAQNGFKVLLVDYGQLDQQLPHARTNAGALGQRAQRKGAR